MSNFINTTPPSDFDTEYYRGSFQQILAQNMGELVRCDFLIGTNQVVSYTGILYTVGERTVVLYQESNDTYVVCDIFNLRFVTFYDNTARRGAQPDRSGVRNQTVR